jgi:hypothetical protein
MMHAMGRLYMMLFFLQIVLVVLALISCLSAEEGDLRALPRIVWVIVILLFPLVGSIVYFAVGRPVKSTPKREQWRPGDGFSEATRPKPVLAPDDDPEFLRSIDRQGKREDEDLLRRWEEDLKRREENLRKRDDRPPTEN